MIRKFPHQTKTKPKIKFEHNKTNKGRKEKKKKRINKGGIKLTQS